MSKSRYSDTPIIDGKFYGTFRIPLAQGGLERKDLLLGVRTQDYVVVSGDRLDHLAAKFWDDDEYWWVLALVNGISYPFASGGFTTGMTLKIPINVRDVLDKLLR